MTRDEVNAMTDEELRGWAWTIAYTERPYKNLVSDKGHANIDNATILVPDYPNDIAAAWELIEHNPDYRWAVYELDGGGWAATLMKVVGTRGEHCLWDHVSEATEDTAARAITRAFILAMTEEGD